MPETAGILPLDSPHRGFSWPLLSLVDSQFLDDFSRIIYLQGENVKGGLVLTSSNFLVLSGSRCKAEVKLGWASLRPMLGPTAQGGVSLSRLPMKRLALGDNSEASY